MERFEKVAWFRNAADTGVMGTLVADGGSLRFESKKGVLLMSTVRGITLSRRGRLAVEYEEGGSYGTAEFADNSRGKFRWKGATRDLESKLRSVLSLAPMTAEDQTRLDAMRAEVKVKAGKQGRLQMAIGALAAVAGLVVTIWTYTGASSSPTGGTYFVAYGPVIFGAFLFVQGLAASRASRR
ncbi:MAG TPA: hypothetical protein VHL78_05560 [Actinomycetota bacterium]|nr:hypothetical protein [Actinomycetota bacterium]